MGEEREGGRKRRSVRGRGGREGGRVEKVEKGGRRLEEDEEGKTPCAVTWF